MDGSSRAIAAAGLEEELELVVDGAPTPVRRGRLTPFAVGDDASGTPPRTNGPTPTQRLDLMLPQVDARRQRR